jgi:hypothetical protein
MKLFGAFFPFLRGKPGKEQLQQITSDSVLMYHGDEVTRSNFGHGSSHHSRTVSVTGA